MATGTGLADAGVSYASVEEAAQARIINAKPMAIQIYRLSIAEPCIACYIVCV